jgi:hypothetical protein
MTAQLQPVALAATEGRSEHGGRRTWAVVHLCTLVAAVPLLFWINRNQWFAGDEWHVIVNNGLGSSPQRASDFAPHFEHWATLPVIANRALFAVFELHTYVPYVGLLIVVILAVTHMLWRFLLRVGVATPYATAVALVFAVLAVGWENRATAWQVSIIAPVGLGLGALLVMPERGPYGRRDLAASLLLVVGLMCSGVGITMTVVVAIAAFLRRGWRVTGAILAIPVVVYGAWYLLEGTRGQRHPPVSTALRGLPDFVWSGLTGALSGLTRVPGAGVAVLVLVAGWLAWRARPRQEPWPLVLAATAGAVASLAFTGLRRAGADPATSRYADIVVVLLLPALALATQDVARRAVRRFGRPLAAVLVVVVVGFLLVQVHALDREVQSELFFGEMKPRVLATAQILRDDEPIISTDVVGLPFAVEPSASTIARLDRHGELPELDVSRADILTAREYLEAVIGPDALFPEGIAEIVHVTGARTTNGAAGCAEVIATSNAPASVTLRFPEAGAFDITTRRTQVVSMRFVEDGSSGRPRPFEVASGEGVTVSISRPGTDVRLTFTVRTTTLCGLAAPHST